MNTTKTKKRQRIFLPGDLMKVLKCHVKKLRWRRARVGLPPSRVLDRGGLVNPRRVTPSACWKL
jgi:hypothetical protein